MKRRYPLNERALKAFVRQSRREGPEQASAGLAIHRRAVDAFAIWCLECKRPECRRARRCAGAPVRNRTSYPHPLPPCITQEQYEALNDWMDLNYGEPEEVDLPAEGTARRIAGAMRSRR